MAWYQGRALLCRALVAVAFPAATGALCQDRENKNRNRGSTSAPAGFGTNAPHSHGVPVRILDSAVSRNNFHGATAAAATVHRRHKHVILGYGIAGRAALAAILRHDPHADVLVVDEKHPPGNPNAPLRRGGGRAEGGGVAFVQGTVRGLDADAGTVTVAAGDDQQVIGFERCLVATGAPPEPLPDGYVDPAAAGSVLPLHGSEACEAAMWRVRRGGSVVILGSGWEALELACRLRQAAGPDDSSGSKHHTGQISMVCAGYGPLDNLLPRYLSTALVKRLRRLGINVTSHSALRYVSAGRDYAPESARGGRQGAPTKGVRVYTCRLHDPLDTCAFNADLLVVARGDKRVERWAEDPQAGLEVGPCGTLTVNQEMMASSNVYAAGDAVSAPHRRLGRAAHLRGADFAHATGAIAGANMALSAQHGGSSGSSSGGSGRGGSSGSGSGSSAQGGATWRHESAPLFAGRAPRAGVHVAFVGDCTAAHDTYGYWWSNAALGRAAAAAHDSVREALQDTENEDSYSSTAQQQGSSSSAQQKAALMRAATRAPGGGVAPPVGKGVVFYLSGGRVRGIMVWGFPVVDEAGAGLGPAAVALMRLIIEETHKAPFGRAGQALTDQERTFVVRTLATAAAAVHASTSVDRSTAELPPPVYRFLSGRPGVTPPDALDEYMFQRRGRTESRQSQADRAYSRAILGDLLSIADKDSSQP